MSAARKLTGLPLALEEAGRAVGREWVRLSDEMMRLQGFGFDRTSPGARHYMTQLAQYYKFVAMPGIDPVRYRMWFIPRDEVIDEGATRYPFTELRDDAGVFSVHLVTAPNESNGADP